MLWPVFGGEGNSPMENMVGILPASLKHLNPLLTHSVVGKEAGR